MALCLLSVGNIQVRARQGLSTGPSQTNYVSAAAVDKFHFRGHMAAYCHKYTNPYNVPLLRDNHTNQSLLEQGFRQFNRHKFSLR